MPLSESTLLAVAGDLIFARGEDYLRYVHELHVSGTIAQASVDGTLTYTAELDWSDGLPDGYCSCPHNADGNFCKHLVAVGLAVIDSGQVVSDEPAVNLDDGVRTVVHAMDLDELRDLVLSRAEYDGELRRMLELRAVADSGDDSPAKAEFEDYVRNTLAFHGFIDYRSSYAVASAAGGVLDELEVHLNDGAAEVVRPALLMALTRLRKISEQADDSSGMIGSECQRAADLYAAACRLGNPDPVKLAKWLVTFRAESPGWPDMALSDFVPAFDDKAFSTYRKEVAALDKKLEGRDHWNRFEADQMMLELADHDEDIDRAIELLSRPDHMQYGAIVNRLRKARRRKEAVAWIDRAVADGRVSRFSGGNDFWLSPDDVAQTYQKLGRTDDAIAVQRAEFMRQPTVENYRALCKFATSIGHVVVERAWAFEHAEQLASNPHTAGAVLIRLYLTDGDLDAAWGAADVYGPGSAWKELAEQGAEVRPIDAADFYRPQLEKDLRHPNSKIYPDIAARLATMGKLYEKGGRKADFAEFMTKIRHDYGRRPALMKALDAKRL